MRLCLLALVACAVVAEPPKITAEQRAKFWRAQAEYIAATVQAQKAKVALEAAQADLVKACGGQQFVAGADGEPTCPEPKAPAKP